MAREYTLAVANVTINGASTFACVNPGGGNVTLEFMRAWIGQAGTATSAQNQVRLVTQFAVAAANQNTGTSQSPVPVKGSDPNSYIYGSTVCGPTTGTGTTGASTVNISAEGNGAKQTLYADSYNVLNGWLWVPTPAETHVLGPSLVAGASSSKSYGIFTPVTPASLTNFSGGLSFRELG